MTKIKEDRDHMMSNYEAKIKEVQAKLATVTKKSRKNKVRDSVVGAQIA